jgi:hypothetical protein
MMQQKQDREEEEDMLKADRTIDEKSNEFIVWCPLLHLTRLSQLL